MEQIKDIVKIHQLEEMFKKVFKSNNPFAEMFQDNVEERIILCPTDGYFLTEKQLKSILDTINEIGEKEFFISITEYEDTFGKDSEHYIISSGIDFNKYIQLPIYLENAIYSTNGEWGILISHEDYAVIGGTSDFISEFKSYYKNWKDDIYSFKRMWDTNRNLYGSDLSWINILEGHLKIDLLK